LEEEHERHVDHGDIQSDETGDPRGPLVRPEDRHGRQPVTGEEADIGLEGTRLEDDGGQEQVQRAGDRDPDEAEQAEDAGAA